MSTDGSLNGKETPDTQPEMVPVTRSAADALQQHTHAAVLGVEYAGKSPKDALCLGLGLTGEFPVAQEFESEAWQAAKAKLGGSLFLELQKARSLGQLSEADIMRYVAYRLAAEDAPSFAFRVLNNTKLGTPQLRMYFAERSFQRLKASRGGTVLAGELATLFGNTTDEYAYFVSLLPPVVPVAAVPVVSEGDEYNEDEENEDEYIEMPDPIEVSMDISMSEMWDKIEEILTPEQSDFLIEEIVDRAKSLCPLLQVDSRFMNESVREFCTMTHHLEAGDFVIDPEELEELLPVRFIDK